ncbi:MAG TPA: holo-ACP synthase [Syntrophomonadaceae bacterium]|nr:holo-ACP synthase [Syntrophomonadaceae bacterium]HOQ09178.1 holo-ACP synthase [Syntrophomonadaceae bacterium]HPU48575.1 holo-ACP synthase [Syntrophomonadaceae bacterium]
MRIGIDIVDIGRFKTVAQRTPRLLQRVFTENELSYCLAKANPYPSLAARFAAKEAFRKLHPDLRRGIRFHDVEVTVDEQGRPEVALHGAALANCQAAGLQSLRISLSHSKMQAIAAIIAEGGNDTDEGSSG